MATSLPPVDLPKNTWVDLYAQTGISVGTRIIVQNTGKDDAFLTESPIEPIQGTGFNKIQPLQYLTNSTSPVGAWALSGRGTTLQVEVA